MSQKYSTSAVPLSPNWRARQSRGGVLSPSRHAVNLNYRRQNSLDDAAGPSWFVLNPLVENNVYPPSALISPHPHSPHPHNTAAATPFLTVALVKLDKLLPQFLKQLSTATFESATKACALFDAAVAPVSAGSRNQKENASSSPHLNSTDNSNDRNKNASMSPTHSILSAASSLANSPASPLVFLNKWLSSPENSSHSTPYSSRQSSPRIGSPSSTPSALALEGEWDNFVAAPFWLFAAAEVLWADLYHLHNDTSLLKGLYQRCTQDFFRLQRLMCDPILAVGDSHRKSESDAARSVYAILETLVVLISCRCQTLELQTSSLEASAGAATGMGVTYHRLEAHKPAAAARPVYDPFLRELKAWKYALEACVAVEQCLFLESIVLIRQWKDQLQQKENSEGETRQSQWLRQAFQQVSSTLPLYLDRPRAFAGPLYGLNTNKSNNELEKLVLEFLRRQQKLSGPPTAVAIILDACGASNLHPERGFRLSADDVVAADETDIRVLWPAVYMRSTMHSTSTVRRGSSNTSSVGSGLLQRSVNASNNAISSFSSSPKSSKRPSRKNVSGVSSATQEEEQVQQCTTLLEYGSDQGVATSWPHSDWEVLVDLLDRRVAGDSSDELVAESVKKSRKNSITSEKDTDLDAETGDGDEEGPGAEAASLTPLYPVAVTYRDALDDTVLIEDPDMSVTGDTSATGFFPDAFSSALSTVSSMPIDDVSNSTKISSTFHLVSLSNWATMIVFVKKEESGRWHRKRTGLADEEIQSFLNAMAGRLRVSAWPSKLSHLPPSKIPKKGNGEAFLASALKSFQQHHGPPPYSNDDKVKILVRGLKDELGLRPMPEVALPVDRSWWQGRSRSVVGTGRSSRGGFFSSLRQQSEAEALSRSAAALFLGTELCHLVAQR